MAILLGFVWWRQYIFLSKGMLQCNIKSKKKSRPIRNQANSDEDDDSSEQGDEEDQFDEELEMKKQKLKAQQFEDEYKNKKPKKLKPRVFGCFWSDPNKKRNDVVYILIN